MKVYEPIECLSPLCRKIFTPTHFNQVYCCPKCVEEAAYERKKEYRQKMRAKKQRDTSAWDEINAFIEQYEKKTGRHIHYGKAVLLMEQQRGR